MKKGFFYLLTVLLLFTFSCSNSLGQDDGKDDKLFEVNKTEGGGTQGNGEQRCSAHGKYNHCG